MSSTNRDDKIVATTLKGHQASVLCLDLSSPDANNDTSSPSNTFLLSGSEDRTARLWDLRENKRASLCIPTTGDVLSAVFAPTATSKTTTTLSSPFAKDHTIYLAVENNVLQYDLRYVQAPIVAISGDESDQKLARNLGAILQNQDEVNQISLAHGSLQKQLSNQKKNSKKGGKKGKNSNKQSTSDATTESDALYLAACDDAGKVRFMAVGEKDDSSDATAAQSTILHHDVNGVVVVPSCAFRPHSTVNKKRGRPPVQLVSGGTDCKVHLWDLARPKKPISSFVVDQQNTSMPDESRPQVCNPPMVHSLAWSPTGQSLAAGLGDGTVAILSVEDNNRLVQTGLLSEGAHESSVVSVVYPEFGGSNDGATENILCSAGSDASILFWDLGSCNGAWVDQSDKMDIEGDDTGRMDDVARLFADSLCINEKKQSDSASLFGKPPSLLFGIPHGHKMNWVTRAASVNGSSQRNSIFVADTSPGITCYTIPMR